MTLDRYEILEEAHTSTFYNWLQHFDPQTLTAEVERYGLAVRAVLGDVAGAVYDPSAAQFAVIARSPVTRPGGVAAAP